LWKTQAEEHSDDNIEYPHPRPHLELLSMYAPTAPRLSSELRQQNSPNVEGSRRAMSEGPIAVSRRMMVNSQVLSAHWDVKLPV
jgi:hypothetical protein